jgi:hypothetical protein
LCNLTRFYYCEPCLGLKEFLKRDYYTKNGVAFEDVETVNADRFEAKLIAENQEYIRVDL